MKSKTKKKKKNLYLFNDLIICTDKKNCIQWAMDLAYVSFKDETDHHQSIQFELEGTHLSFQTSAQNDTSSPSKHTILFNTNQAKLEWTKLIQETMQSAKDKLKKNEQPTDHKA